MSQIFNATEEISAMAAFDKIRYKPYFIVSFDNFSSKLLICDMKFSGIKTGIVNDEKL